MASLVLPCSWSQMNIMPSVYFCGAKALGNLETTTWIVKVDTSPASLPFHTYPKHISQQTWFVTTYLCDNVSKVNTNSEEFYELRGLKASFLLWTCLNPSCPNLCFCSSLGMQLLNVSSKAKPAEHRLALRPHTLGQNPTNHGSHGSNICQFMRQWHHINGSTRPRFSINNLVVDIGWFFYCIGSRSIKQKAALWYGIDQDSIITSAAKTYSHPATY